MIDLLFNKVLHRHIEKTKGLPKATISSQQTCQLKMSLNIDTIMTVRLQVHGYMYNMGA